MTLTDQPHQRRAPAKVRRVWALVRKEAYQISRDPSSIAIGVVLPVLLILLFGYGLSLDVRHVPVAVVLEDASPEARELVAGFQLSPYFDVQLVTSMPRAQELMLARQVDGIVRIRPDFARRLSLGDAEVQVLVHGPTPTAPALFRATRREQLGSGGCARPPRAARVRPDQSCYASGCGLTKPTRVTTSWCLA